MFLYRENYYDKDKEAQEQIEVVDLSLASCWRESDLDPVIS